MSTKAEAMGAEAHRMGLPRAVPPELVDHPTWRNGWLRGWDRVERNEPTREEKVHQTLLLDAYNASTLDELRAVVIRMIEGES